MFEQNARIGHGGIRVQVPLGGVDSAFDAVPVGLNTELCWPNRIQSYFDLFQVHGPGL